MIHHPDTLIRAAAARTETAKAVLETALEAGEDTATAREIVEAAESEVQRLEDLAAEQIAREQAVESEATRAEAAALTAETEGELIRELSTLLAEVAVPAVELPQATAAALLRARASAAEEADVGRVLADKATALRTRLDELRTRRADIVTRRAEGDQRASDGADLALMDADIEGVAGLLARLADETKDQGPGFAATNLQAATRAWEAALAEARTDALGELAGKLDAALAATVTALRASTTNFSRQWRPGKRLQAELSRVGFAR